MSNFSKDEMTRLRQKVAVDVCISHPKVFDAVLITAPTYLEPKERDYYVVVDALMKLEPSIKHILSYYHKRERRG